MSESDKGGLTNLMHEERHFDPPEDLAAHANVKADVYDLADADRLAFWGKAAERISWAEPFTEVLDWSNPPFAKWFVGGKLNASYNCVDRHVEAGNGERVAYPLGRRARGRHPRRHLRPAQGRGLPGRQRARSSSACRPATGSRSTCR